MKGGEGKVALFGPTAFGRPLITSSSIANSPNLMSTTGSSPGAHLQMYSLDSTSLRLSMPRALMMASL
eukprot:1158654-Pelagomonas_calceolata.AAC.1